MFIHIQEYGSIIFNTRNEPSVTPIHVDVAFKNYFLRAYEAIRKEEERDTQ
jgi:hypothetical protein